MSTAFWASYIALWSLAIVLFVAVFAMYHHFGQMYLGSPEGRSKQGPELGKVLQPSVVHDWHGQQISLPVTGKPGLILFVSTSCQPCRRIWPAFRSMTNANADIAVTIVCSGDVMRMTEWTIDLADEPKFIPDSRRIVFAHFGVGVTPFSVAYDETGVVASKGVADTEEVLNAMIGEARTRDDRQVV